MKHVPNKQATNYQGSPLLIVERDNLGNVVWEDEGQGRPSMVEARMAQVLWALIMGLPGQTLTRQDSIHATRLYAQINKHLTQADDVNMNIEDAEYDWIIHSMKDDKVGVRIFGVNSYVIEQQLAEVDTQE